MTLCAPPFSDEPALNGVIHSEMRELEKAAKKAKLSLKDYIKQQLQPLQDKLSTHPNQLITALSVGVKSEPTRYVFAGGAEDFHNVMHTSLYIGATTETTALRPFSKDKNNFNSFMTGLQFAFVYHVDSLSTEKFHDINTRCFGVGGFFDRSSNPEDVDIVFRDKEDPRVPHASGFEYVRRKLEGKPPIPRLTISIGPEAVSALEENLRGYECLVLSRLVDAKGFPFPFTPAMTEKFVREEQELYQDIVGGEKNKRDLAYEAKSRGYDQHGIDFIVRSGGVSSEVNAKEFFEKYIKQHARN